MNTRALMALVVINIGADMGVISTAAFFWLVAMALFTASREACEVFRSFDSYLPVLAICCMSSASASQATSSPDQPA